MVKVIKQYFVSLAEERVEFRGIVKTENDVND